MAPRNDTSLLIALQWVALVAALFVTAVAVYDLLNGQNNMTTWFSLILWPVIAILNVVQLVRLNRRKTEVG